MLIFPLLFNPLQHPKPIAHHLPACLAMAPTKPILIIIPGGWHVPSRYNKLQSALETAGYAVQIPALPSVSEARPPVAGLSIDTAFMRAYTEKLIDGGHTVAVIMHSYSGQVGTNALCGLGVDARKAEGKPGGVSQLIYMTAFAVTEGKAMIDKVKEFGHEELMPLAFDFADDRTVLPRDPFYLIGEAPGLTKEEIDAYAQALATTRWNGDCMYQAIEKCAWREIPVAYVYATKDTCVPLDYQKSMVEGMRKEGVEVGTWEVETGHCPNLTAVQGLVDVVGQILG